MGFFKKVDINKLRANKNIKKLIQALQEKNQLIREKAAAALSEIGGDVVVHLEEQLGRCYYAINFAKGSQKNQSGWGRNLLQREIERAEQKVMLIIKILYKIKTNEAMRVLTEAFFKISWEARLALVKYFKDQTLLANIAEKDEEREVIIAAMNKLADQTVLVKVAKTNRDIFVRAAAVEKITDQGVLAEIVGNDENDHVCETAAKKLLEADPLRQAFFVRKLKKDDEAHAAAVSNVTKQSGLAYHKELCSICGQDVSGKPVMEHKPSGAVCCEECGRKLGGASDFVYIARNSRACSRCDFIYIPGISAFDKPAEAKCPRCGQNLETVKS